MENIEEWGNKTFIKISKKRFENFVRYFLGKKKIEGNSFMGWHDYYDWSLRKEEHKVGSWEAAEDCMVARCFFETPEPEYYVSTDYVKDNNYDLNTVVPKPRKRRLTKKEKKLADALCKAFDEIFREEARRAIYEDKDQETK